MLIFLDEFVKTDGLDSEKIKERKSGKGGKGIIRSDEAE